MISEAWLLERSIPEPNTGCWLWLLGTDQDGYGKTFADGHHVRAHRLALEMKTGPLGDMKALHRCDVPGCVNPDHLFPGTVADNNRDMMAKNRNAHGDRFWSTKLTEESVRQIRSRQARGESMLSLSKEFGVAFNAVRNVIIRKTWRRVA